VSEVYIHSVYTEMVYWEPIDKNILLVVYIDLIVYTGILHVESTLVLLICTQPVYTGNQYPKMF
jgi:hypothetical protein